MKIAILSDIHSNLPALQAVLSDLPAVDACVCCGDVVGYYLNPDEVCDLLRSRNMDVVQGNHDAYTVGSLSPSVEKKPYYKIEYTIEHLCASNYTWLNSLPVELKFTCGDLRFTMRHASPWDMETYIYPNSQRLQEIKLNKNEILLLGHTHHPMWFKAGDGMIINPGSVGQPRDWNPHACYSILDTVQMTVDTRRVEYAVASYQNQLVNLGWDQSTVEILSRQKESGQRDCDD